jgi:hypothetical protein
VSPLTTEQFISLLEQASHENSKSYYKPTRKEIATWFERINSVVFCGRIYATFGRIEIRRRHGIWAEYSGWTDPRRNAAGRSKILQESPFLKCCPNTVDQSSHAICGLLSITNRFPNERIFVEVLAHEMVHLYQFLHSSPRFSFDAVSHGKSFHAWKPMFEKCGLRLRVTLKHAPIQSKKRTRKARVNANEA